MDFEPCFKVFNLVSIHPKSMKLGPMTNLSVIFYVAVSIYRLVTIWNSPQFPAEFRNGLLEHGNGGVVVFSISIQPSANLACERAPDCVIGEIHS